MNSFVICTTVQGNSIAINLDKVFYMRRVSEDSTLIYVSEKELVHVKESIEEILKIAERNKVYDMSEVYRSI